MLLLRCAVSDSGSLDGELLAGNSGGDEVDGAVDCADSFASLLLRILSASESDSDMFGRLLYPV